MAMRQYAVLGPLRSGSETRAFLGCEVIDGQPQPDSPVVIVWLPEDVTSDPKSVARLQRETAFVTQLRHPNIIRVYGLECFDEGWARVVSFVDGEPLARVLARGKEQFRPLDPRIAARMIVDVCEGVHFAHEEGQSRYAGRPIVHGGIRPDTMIVGFGGRTMVTGYGASALAPSQHGVAVHDKFVYSAPEQIIGGKATASPATDVYAIGAMLYELVAGHPPYAGVTDVEKAVLTGDPPHVEAEGLAGRLGNIVKTAMAKRGADRFENVEVLKDAIMQALKDDGVELPLHEDVAAFVNELIPMSSPERRSRVELLESAGDPDNVTILSRPSKAPEGVDEVLFEASRPGPVTTQYSAFGAHETTDQVLRPAKKREPNTVIEAPLGVAAIAETMEDNEPTQAGQSAWSALVPVEAPAPVPAAAPPAPQLPQAYAAPQAPIPAPIMPANQTYPGNFGIPAVQTHPGAVANPAAQTYPGNLPAMVPMGWVQVPMQPMPGMPPQLMSQTPMPMPMQTQPPAPGLRPFVAPKATPQGTPARQTPEAMLLNQPVGLPPEPHTVPGAKPKAPMRDESSITQFNQRVGDGSRAMVGVIVLVALALIVFIIAFPKEPPAGLDQPSENVTLPKELVHAALEKKPEDETVIGEEDPIEVPPPANGAEVDPTVAPVVAKDGELSIHSEPEVDVFAGNDLIGRTPVTTRLPVGKWKLRFTDKKTGINAYRTYRIKPAGVHRDRITFGTSQLEVRAPDGALVMLNSKVLGKAPLEPVTIYEGEYILRVTFDGMNWSERFDAPPGQKIEYKVRLGDK